MGRQIPIAAVGPDEQDLLAFLRSTADIAIFETFAATQAQLWVDNVAPEYPGHIAYRIWNRQFEWRPEYRVTRPDAGAGRAGFTYVSNSNEAPVLEFMRTHPETLEAGRLYWAKDFAAPRGLAYDVAAFGQWIDVVFRWVRRRGRKRSAGPGEPYYLPAAWNRMVGGG